MIVNEILGCIAQAIHEEFGDGYAIYDEMKEQELKEPCFFVFSLSAPDSLVLGIRDSGERHYRPLQFGIQYFPSSHNRKAECNDVADRLFHCLEWIEASDGPLIGSGMDRTYSDDVLTVTVNYNLYTMSHSEKPIMEDLTQNTSVEE